jgi:hypothetical protein
MERINQPCGRRVRGPTMRCSEPGMASRLAIRASRVPGRWVVRRRPARLGFLRALCVSVVIFTTEAQRPQREFCGSVAVLRRGANFFSCISRGSRLASERSDIAGRRCGFWEIGRRRFEAMRITPPNQTLQRTRLLRSGFGHESQVCPAYGEPGRWVVRPMHALWWM